MNKFVLSDEFKILAGIFTMHTELKLATSDLVGFLCEKVALPL
jgi:hypothetical protein